MALDRGAFAWKGLALHHGRRKVPVLTLVPEHEHPHLFRITYPDGWTSTPGNLTRARDAAYGHARYLLGGEKPAERGHSREGHAPDGEIAELLYGAVAE